MVCFTSCDNSHFSYELEQVFETSKICHPAMRKSEVLRWLAGSSDGLLVGDSR